MAILKCQWETGSSFTLIDSPVQVYWYDRCTGITPGRVNGKRGFLLGL